MAAIVSRHARRRRRLIAFAFAAALTAPSRAQAEDNSAAPTPPAATQNAPAAPAAGGQRAPAAQKLFTRAELEKLLAPIALYPDALLAQLLAASAYPIQIVEAQRWLDKNKAAVAKNDFSWIDSRNWDPAVKALARFPTVIKTMSDDLDWTTDLGDAEVNQPEDVADVIQELRAKAEKAGALKATPQQTVSSVFVDDRSYITIEPVEPSIVYVPIYEPAAVYEPTVIVAPLVTFGAAIVVAAPRNRHCWDWRTGAIYPPVWAGYPGWRPPYPGRRPGQPFLLGGRPLGENINVGNTLKPWRPGADYRPPLGSGVGVNRLGDGSIIVNRSRDGTTITIRGGNTIDRPDGGNNTVNTRPAASNFDATRPAAGNLVNTRPGAGNFINSRPGGVSVIDHAPSVAVAPRVAPVLPNFSPRGAPAMSGIRLGVGAVASGSRGVISRGPVGGGLVGGAMARPGGFGGGGFGAGLR